LEAFCLQVVVTSMALVGVCPVRRPIKCAVRAENGDTAGRPCVARSNARSGPKTGTPQDDRISARSECVAGRLRSPALDEDHQRRQASRPGVLRAERGRSDPDSLRCLYGSAFAFVLASEKHSGALPCAAPFWSKAAGRSTRRAIRARR